MEPLEGTRYWEEGRSPELSYLQLKRPGDITWQDKVYAALGRQVQDAEALRQVKESSPVLIHTSDSAHADECMLVSRSRGSEPEARALATLRQSCATVAKDTILTRPSPG